MLSCHKALDEVIFEVQESSPASPLALVKNPLKFRENETTIPPQMHFCFPERWGRGGGQRMRDFLFSPALQFSLILPNFYRFSLSLVFWSVPLPAVLLVPSQGRDENNSKEEKKKNKFNALQPQGSGWVHWLYRRTGELTETETLPTIQHQKSKNIANGRLPFSSQNQYPQFWSKSDFP